MRRMQAEVKRIQQRFREHLAQLHEQYRQIRESPAKGAGGKPASPIPRLRTYARLRSELRAQHPSIPPGTWHPVLPENPRALQRRAEPGSIWVEVDGRVRQLPAEYFVIAVVLAAAM